MVYSEAEKSNEFLLKKDDRLAYEPLEDKKYQEYCDKIMNMYITSTKCGWTHREIDVNRDKNDWEKLDEGQKTILKYVLAFFASSDTLVNRNLNDNFIPEVQPMEAKFFFNFQAMMEDEHTLTYAKFLRTYVDDQKERKLLFNAFETMKEIKDKISWVLKWMQSDKSSFATRCVAFAAIEGIFFSGSFAIIFWFKTKGLMHGLIQANELISKDEGLHTQFSCLLYSMIENKPSEETVKSIIKEAVDIELAFQKVALSKAQLGLNIEQMTLYIQFVGDYLMTQLGYDKIYNVKNPFSFMDNLGLPGQTNFFETRSSDYQTGNNVKFNLVEDF